MAVRTDPIDCFRRCLLWLVQMSPVSILILQSTFFHLLQLTALFFFSCFFPSGFSCCCCCPILIKQDLCLPEDLRCQLHFMPCVSYLLFFLSSTCLFLFPFADNRRLFARVDLVRVHLSARLLKTEPNNEPSLAVHSHLLVSFCAVECS